MSLVLNVFSNHICSNFISYASNEVSVIPQFARPQLFPQLGIFFKDFPCRYAFHNLYYFCWRVLRHHFHKYVNMVFHNFHRIYIEFVMFRYLAKCFFQVFPYLFPKQFLPIFRYPDYMVFQVVDGMLSPFYSHAAFIPVVVPFGNLFLLPVNRFHPPSKLGGIQRISL